MASICAYCNQEACVCSGQTPLCPDHFDELRRDCLSRPVPPEPVPEPDDV